MHISRLPFAKHLAKLSLTARLTLFFTLLSCAVLLALGWLIGASIDAHFKEQDKHALEGKLQLAQHIIERVANEQDVANLADQLGDALVGHHDLAIAVIDNQNKVLLASEHVTFPAERLRATDKSGKANLYSWVKGGESYRGLTGIFQTKEARYSPITVAVATDIAHHNMFMHDFMRTLWLFVAGAALLTAVLAWFAASRGLRPLRNMGERAASVTATRLDQRLAEEDVPPELADLATSLNQMLARLEEAFQRLSDFSSDLAHELRTPINNLMMQTQVSLTRARDATSYREILESNAEEYARLARMIADMLFLAKADNGVTIAHIEQVELSKEVSDLFEFYEALAEEKQITLRLEGHAMIPGDRLMLRRALSNLLSNALRHTPSSGEIRVSILDHGQDVECLISNPGITVADHHLSRLFERFYRADHARQHSDGEGSGLGLAIVLAIVIGHRGRIEATSKNGLTCFKMMLPR